MNSPASPRGAWLEIQEEAARKGLVSQANRREPTDKRIPQSFRAEGRRGLRRGANSNLREQTAAATELYFANVVRRGCLRLSSVLTFAQRPFPWTRLLACR